MSEQGNISKAKLLNGLYRKRAILPNGVGINGIPDWSTLGNYNSETACIEFEKDQRVEGLNFTVQKSQKGFIYGHETWHYCVNSDGKTIPPFVLTVEVKHIEY